MVKALMGYMAASGHIKAGYAGGRVSISLDDNTAPVSYSRSLVNGWVGLGADYLTKQISLGSL